MAKETYVYGKRDLCIWQKRPTYMAKETYVYGNVYVIYHCGIDQIDEFM